jgi:hypothetical protein
MKNFLKALSFIFIGIVIAVVFNFTFMFNIHSFSQATSILKENGTLVSDKDELNYYSNHPTTSPIELEALYILSKNYTKIMIYNVDEKQE